VHPHRLVVVSIKPSRKLAIACEGGTIVIKPCSAILDRLGLWLRVAVLWENVVCFHRGSSIQAATAGGDLVVRIKITTVMVATDTITITPSTGAAFFTAVTDTDTC
jgi:hypothetical protein